MRRSLILVAGVIAAGKSTFARRLSAELGVPCFCKDNINEIVGDCLAFHDREERKKLSIAAVRLLLHIADGLLAVDMPVILESNFKPDEAADVRRLVEKHSCPMLTYHFSGDAQVLYDRFMLRENSGARHPIHKTHTFTDVSGFAEAVSPLAAFNAGGERICVDATDFSLIDFESLISAAKDFVQG